jgi:uncharacterized heparinase superfamily protein
MRIETHLMGNHLLENAVTLTLLGATFAGAEGARWRAKGLRLLGRELAEQILPDGIHFELSPMYHLRVTWLLQMLDGLGDEEVSAMVRGPRSRARAALSRLRHPDGGISLFNDAGLGVYSEAVEGSEAAWGAWSLPDAGYYGFSNKNGDGVICDAGRLGPDHQPGHAHADCLSFELALGGVRIVTDSGVSDYGISSTRSQSRATAAHNTVEVNGESQAELWGAFRVGARGYPREVKWRPLPAGFVLEAAHSGYERLAAKVTHRRRFEYGGGRFVIWDRVEGRGSYRAVGRLHFSPHCGIEAGGDGIVITWRGGAARLRVHGPGKLSMGDSPYYERFGERQTRRMIEYEVEVREAAEWEMTLEWKEPRCGSCS